MPLQTVALPAFHDNYIWCLNSNGQALVVDPGDATVVQDWLDREGLTLAILLITHHHPDHIGGLTTLRERYQPVVYGPDENINGLTQVLLGGESLALPGFGGIQVIATPGHTRAHISYYLPADRLLFCGDTLFSAGCGRLFEGTAAQLHASLQTLACLPDDTLVCCSHEYTTANLRFAEAVEPANPAIAERQAEVRSLRDADLPSLPVSLGREKLYNPFLRTSEPAIVTTAQEQTGAALMPGLDVFTALRTWKDRF